MEIRPPRSASAVRPHTSPETTRSHDHPYTDRTLTPIGDPSLVLSTDEIDLLHRKFAIFNPHPTNKTRPLPANHACKLIREDCPFMTEWEIQEWFQKYDLNGDGQLALSEYIHQRAEYKVRMEMNNENDLIRSFAIMDMDHDGMIIADDVLKLIEVAQDPSARLLKSAIIQASIEAQDAKYSKYRYKNKREGEITLEHFLGAVRDANRKKDQEIAAKALRVSHLEEMRLKTGNGSPTKIKTQALDIEIEVLRKEILRAKCELITEGNSALTKICETLVATYENEQHVYECLSNLITYMSLKDPPLFRYKLEQSGRAVNVLDSILMAPPFHLKKSNEYAQMMDLTLQSQTSSSKTSSTGQHRHGHLLVHAHLRKQFVYYTMAGNVTNLETMTRTNFIKFAKDCNLHLLVKPACKDPDLANIYAIVTANTMGAMGFTEWLDACEMLYHRTREVNRTNNMQEDDHDFTWFMQTHVLNGAHVIHTQNLAPDVTQAHVLKLLGESLWPLKQVFTHFNGQSLVEIDPRSTLDMKMFLSFARAFHILRVTTKRDGEPYTPPPLSESTVIQPISLRELIQEYYAAKLDISFSNPRRRESPDLTFREFLRCLERVALAMHAHNPKRHLVPPNGIYSTSFEAIKDEGGDKVPRQITTPLYNRRGNIMGGGPVQKCKMTSTAIINKLIQASNTVTLHPVKPGLLDSQTTQESSQATPGKMIELPLMTESRSPRLASLASPCIRSPNMKIVYRASTQLDSVNTPPWRSTRVVEPRSTRTSAPNTPSSQNSPMGESVASLYIGSRDSTTSLMSISKRTSIRPPSCGGPPLIRLIRSPE